MKTKPNKPISDDNSTRAIEELPTDTLIPYARNARTHSDAQIAQIAASIKEFGFNNPVLVDHEGGIIAGHGRVLAARKLGLGSVPCLRLSHLSETQKRAYILADNKLALNAGWDEEMLKVELEALNADGLDMAMTGFDADELKKLMTIGITPSDADAEPQIDKADELAKKWGVEPWQMWRLGDHRIICGDSTDTAVVERVMGREKASLVFTDPPYGVAIGAKNAMLNSVQKAGLNLKPIEDDALKPDDLKKRLLPAFVNIKNIVMADDCTVFVTAPQGGSLGMMMMMMMMESGLQCRHVLIWKKNSPTFSMGRLDYDSRHCVKPHTRVVVERKYGLWFLRATV